MRWKYAANISFFGARRDRFNQYQPDRSLAERFALVASVEGMTGIELKYPADLQDPTLVTQLCEKHQLAISAINVNTKDITLFRYGALSSPHAESRDAAVHLLQQGMDLAAELGVELVTTCPLSDGYDYPFQYDYGLAWDHFIDSVRRAARHRRDVTLLLEYQPHDPVARVLLNNVGKLLHVCAEVGLPNLAANLDVGHALAAGEFPAESAALLARKGLLRYMHSNDNTGEGGDWDMISGSIHFWQWLELIHTLLKLRYQGWIGADLAPRHFGPVAAFRSNITLIEAMTRLVESVGVDQIDAMIRQEGSTTDLYEMFAASIAPEKPSKQPVSNSQRKNSMSRPAPAYPELNAPPRLLLGPGPSTVDPRVLKAMATPLVGHLDPYFIEIMNRSQELLRYVFETENALTIPVSGTGTAAMEAAVANLVEPGDGVLVCVNGYFGGRIADMAARYGGEVQTITRPWGEVFTPEEVRQALRARPARVVAIVHAETSTGALQPLEEIAQVVHEFDALLIVDAVTSLGGLPVRVDATGIDACYSGSQKCLSCPPGIGPITFGPRAIEKLANRRTKVTNWYLDLSLVQKYWGSERTYHHTAPISMNYACYEALRIVAQEGLEARWERHARNARLLWEGLEELDLALHVDPAHRLPSLTTVRVPEAVDEAALRRDLLERYHIEISGGLGELKGRVWRIGLMGYSSREENVLLLLAALRELLKR